MPGFPRLGAPGPYTEPTLPTHGLFLQSQGLPDGLISTHERYGTIHDNIYTHRGGRPCKFKTPIYKDTNTPWPRKESFQFSHQNDFQEDDPDMKASLRVFYMALAWPSDLAFAGSKSRFKRKPFEKHATFMISCTIEPFDLHPRWSSTAMYVSDDTRLRPFYGPPEIKADPAIKGYLEQHRGMGALLASHYANILARDPIALTKNELKSYESLDVFENLYSAVWPHVDFKLPSKNGEAGWRAEFRLLEVPLTDFENAAFAVFVALLTRAILHYDLNFYIPIDRVAENMQRAHTRNAVREQRIASKDSSSVKRSSERKSEDAESERSRRRIYPQTCRIQTLNPAPARAILHR
ncbi:uncharacterized protein A1O5_00281 [Cladophialophora psammophila CBS 110553]|uniref:Glutamate--cysteine ligase n=1 Tax=Cladophialophora psammophila CBS 110553 TaxID=1182543 RepID=W9XZS8_9EURO|nr:uncharacterized protein A1O5_00281 [Cladophialophora psammophila CBS 110553]EXJ75774.1 hypothetical protein A1O5_00281 [Cladophialophora psammophila CBS 110553]